MITTEEFIVNLNEKSRIKEVNFDDLVFGKEFADHMLEMDFENDNWSVPHIKPYGALSLSPACSGLHYGQSIFEGMKAYYNKNGKVGLFRPYMNAARFNKSATRMGMVSVPEEIFVNNLRKLIDIDREWVPKTEGGSLYIRPYMFGNDPFIGVRTSENYKYLIFTLAVGAYYSKPVKVLISDYFSRSMNGGTGFAKAAGNYAATMYPTMKAKEKGFDQILWTDSVEHKYVQEIGTMNIFFIIDGKAYTPAIDGNILEGVTRDSVIQLLQDEGFDVNIKPITIDELRSANNKGTLQEAFGTGTAASVAFIEEMNYKGETISFSDKNSTVANTMKTRLNNIKYGVDEDKFDWMMWI